MIKSILILFLAISLGLNAQTIKKESFTECGENKEAIQLAKIILQHQERVVINCSKELSLAAEYKAKNMAEENMISHYVDNKSPNEVLRKRGVKLPNNYSIIGNQVEAISGGVTTAQEAFDYFLTSEDHKDLVIGKGKLFQKQDQIGVGYYYDPTKKHEYYWVVYTISSSDSAQSNNLTAVFVPNFVVGKAVKVMPMKEDTRYSTLKRDKNSKGSVKISKSMKH